ncbi:ATP-binding protein [Afipia sp. DC4300-2b1]|uniref:ATP-binding protein n=1 Tax=Afipia sp. DC4300-2b1 TaxID=2804672 RepID=UPI003CF85D0A
MTSLKGRLIGVAVVWILVGVLVSGVALSTVFKTHVTQQFYEELYVHLDELQGLVTVTSSGPHLQRPLSDPRYDVPLSGYYWEVQKPGRIVASSTSLQGGVLLGIPPDDPPDGTVHTHMIDGPTGKVLVAERVHRYNPSDPPLRFIIGTDRRHLESVLQGFNSTLAWSMGAFAGSMIIAASGLILFALRPLNYLRTALNRVRSGSEKKLQGNFPQEVQPLVDELNAMLRSMTELMIRARAQAGNLAHGLKTPLAILTDEAYRIEDKGLPQSSVIILDQCRRMQTQIDYQIARARAVAMHSVPGTLTSVGKAGAEVTSALSRLYQPKGIVIENDIPSTVTAACDAQDLNEMLANLVDNACKHAKGRVLLSCAEESPQHTVRVVVEDDGPGLPPEAFEVVFNVGERWDSQAPGSGLGLSIVRDLVRLYGGDIALDTSSLGGLKVVLDLPRFRTLDDRVS